MPVDTIRGEVEGWVDEEDSGVCGSISCGLSPGNASSLLSVEGWEEVEYSGKGRSFKDRFAVVLRGISDTK